MLGAERRFAARLKRTMHSTLRTQTFAPDTATFEMAGPYDFAQMRPLRYLAQYDKVDIRLLVDCVTMAGLSEYSETFKCGV
jgi:hypothetical protein